VIAGALWTFASPALALGFSAVLCAVAAAVLWLAPPGDQRAASARA
jgi:hypothetical protein